jgi:DDE superfamily endonuclease.
LFLACYADGNDEPLVTGKYRSLHCVNNVKKLTIKYVTSRSSWITTILLGEYLSQLDRKMDAKNKKDYLSLIIVLLTQRTQHFCGM